MEGGRGAMLVSTQRLGLELGLGVGLGAEWRDFGIRGLTLCGR